MISSISGLFLHCLLKKNQIFLLISCDSGLFALWLSDKLSEFPNHCKLSWDCVFFMSGRRQNILVPLFLAQVLRFMLCGLAYV